jgi:hypothetical protein
VAAGAPEGLAQRLVGRLGLAQGRRARRQAQQRQPELVGEPHLPGDADRLFEALPGGLEAPPGHVRGGQARQRAPLQQRGPHRLGQRQALAQQLGGLVEVAAQAGQLAVEEQALAGGRAVAQRAGEVLGAPDARLGGLVLAGIDGRPALADQGPGLGLAVAGGAGHRVALLQGRQRATGIAPEQVRLPPAVKRGGQAARVAGLAGQRHGQDHVQGMTWRRPFRPARQPLVEGLSLVRASSGSQSSSSRSSLRERMPSLR